MWDRFESVWATTFMVYPINDGENPDYQQETPRQRILAYLKDLKSGKAQSCLILMRDVYV